MAHGFAPAVVVAQAVRLIANIVREAEQRRLADDVGDTSTTEVRALQLGLSSVPRVDPRAPRSLDEYCSIYREWLLLLKGRLQQQSLELPPEVFDEGDNELMRYALCYSVLQARSLKEALIAMDKTLFNVRDFVAWWPKYQFLSASDLEAWGRITWWEGPDPEGRLWMMVDNRAAVSASRTHGADAVSRVIISNVEYGVRVLMSECDCLDTINVVIDNAGVAAGQALRMRSHYHRVASTLERFYPSRLYALYVVNTPLPLRVTFRASVQFLQAGTRRKVKACKAKDVPCGNLPSSLRSHKLSTAAGLDALGFAAGDAAPGGGQPGGGGGGGQPGGGGGGGAGASDADGWSDVQPPVTPIGRTPRARRGGVRHGGGGRRASSEARAAGLVAAGIVAAGAVAAAMLSQREGLLLPAMRGVGGGSGSGAANASGA